MVYELLNVLSNSVSQRFVEDFCIYVHQLYWPVIYFFYVVFAGFQYQGDGGLVECFWMCSFLFSFLKEFQKDRHQLFSKCLIEFSCEAIWFWAFVFLGDFFIRASISVLVIGLFIISISVHFFLVIHFIAIQLLITVSYNPLYFCIVCCNLSFFISNFLDLVLLSFFLDEFG